MDDEKTGQAATDTNKGGAAAPLTDKIIDVVVDGGAALTKAAAKRGQAGDHLRQKNQGGQGHHDRGQEGEKNRGEHGREKASGQENQKTHPKGCSREESRQEDYEEEVGQKGNALSLRAIHGCTGKHGFQSNTLERPPACHQGFGSRQ